MTKQRNLCRRIIPKSNAQEKKEMKKTYTSLLQVLFMETKAFYSFSLNALLLRKICQFNFLKGNKLYRVRLIIFCVQYKLDWEKRKNPMKSIEIGYKDEIKGKKRRDKTQ